MRRMLSMLLLLTAASIAVPATSALASAAPGFQQFGVRLFDVPVAAAHNPRALRYIIDFVHPGSLIRRRILVLNQETRPARFAVYPDAARITQGMFVGDPGETRSELTSWTRLQYRTLTLRPGASALDMVTIRVPRGATRGEHYGVIWVQQTAKPRARDGESGVVEVSRVGVRLYVAVGRGGAPPTSFDITSVTGHLTDAGRPVIVAHVNNTGGRAIDVNGSARLADGPGGTSSGPFPAQRIVTLAPGQSWNMTFAAPKSLPDGSWQVTVTLASGLTKATATAPIQLIANVAPQAATSGTPWIWLALGGLVVLVVATGWYARQHRRRQAPA